MKQCSKCSEAKQLTEFHKSQSACKDCCTKRRRVRYLQNKTQENARNKVYREGHKEEKRKYRKQNSDKRRERQNFRTKNDDQFRLARNLRRKITHLIRGGRKNSSATIKDLGCSLEFFHTYLENLFQENMNWENYGQKGWHVDHIKPLSKFDLTDGSQLLEACHYTNLQPLWWKENLSKGNGIKKS